MKKNLLSPLHVLSYCGYAKSSPPTFTFTSSLHDMLTPSLTNTNPHTYPCQLRARHSLENRLDDLRIGSSHVDKSDIHRPFTPSYSGFGPFLCSSHYSYLFFYFYALLFLGIGIGLAMVILLDFICIYYYLWAQYYSYHI
jgi:hypothetical protein